MTDKYEAPKWIGNLFLTLLLLLATALASGLLFFLFRWLYHLTG